jgi:type II secretory pathway component GspD/PulD (secretin)
MPGETMKTSLVALILLFSLTPATRAQTSKEQPEPLTVKTFYLSNVNTNNDGEYIKNAISYVLPGVPIAYVPSRNALFVRGNAEQLAQVQQLLSSLDRAKHAYRLTYTISDFDGERLVGKQHFSLVVVSGGRTTLKSGSKIPIATGSADDKGSTQTQFTYLDLGLNFDASLDDNVDGMRLRSKVERSSVPDDKTIAGVNEPVIRQSVLEGTSLLTPGKPLLLGSMDTPSSTRRLDIEVVMDPIK